MGCGSNALGKSESETMSGFDCLSRFVHDSLAPEVVDCNQPNIIELEANKEACYLSHHFHLNQKVSLRKKELPVLAGDSGLYSLHFIKKGKARKDP